MVQHEGKNHRIEAVIFKRESQTVIKPQGQRRTVEIDHIEQGHVMAVSRECSAECALGSTDIQDSAPEEMRVDGAMDAHDRLAANLFCKRSMSHDGESFFCGPFLLTEGAKLKRLRQDKSTTQGCDK